MAKGERWEEEGDAQLQLDRLAKGGTAGTGEDEERGEREMVALIARDGD